MGFKTGQYKGLSFDGNFLSFSLAQGPPRDLQIIAYKYDSAYAHNRLAELAANMTLLMRSFDLL